MGTGESLAASERVQRLQTALHARAKEAPGFRFYSLSDKVWRDDVLVVAWPAVRRKVARMASHSSAVRPQGLAAACAGVGGLGAAEALAGLAGERPGGWLPVGRRGAVRLTAAMANGSGGGRGARRRRSLRDRPEATLSRTGRRARDAVRSRTG